MTALSRIAGIEPNQSALAVPPSKPRQCGPQSFLQCPAPSLQTPPPP